MSLEWDVTTIGELCSNVSSGGTPKSTNEEYYGGNIPWLNTKEINFNRIYDTEKHITNEGFKNSAAKWVKKDSVIVAMYGATAAKVAMNMVDLTTNQACCNLTIDKSLANPKFVYYYLYSNYERLLNLASGAAQQNLNSNIIKEFPINIPSLNVQNEIVNLLSTIDDKIELNQKINKNLEEQIETIYNSFFVYYDDFSKEELEECEIGLIPKDWKLMSLGEVTTKIKEKVGSDDYKVFSAVNTGNLILSEEYFDKQVYSKNIEKYIVVKQKEFAYNPARINIGSIGKNDFNYDGCVSPVYVAFKVEEGYENFMNMYIKSNRFNQWVVTLSSGSVRQTLNYADFSIIKIAYPPKDLVNKFNKVYDNYYEVINYNNSVISNLENIRDTLLPKLMSGEIDVSKINCDLKIIIRKIYIKSFKLFLWRYLSENKNYIKNTKSNETLLKSRTIYQINKFLAKFNARYRYYRQ